MKELKYTGTGIKDKKKVFRWFIYLHTGFTILFLIPSTRLLLVGGAKVADVWHIYYRGALFVGISYYLKKYTIK